MCYVIFECDYYVHHDSTNFEEADRARSQQSFSLEIPKYATVIFDLLSSFFKRARIFFRRTNSWGKTTEYINL